MWWEVSVGPAGGGQSFHIAAWRTPKDVLDDVLLGGASDRVEGFCLPYSKDSSGTLHVVSRYEAHNATFVSAGV